MVVMSKPEHVRCENCLWWRKGLYVGLCYRGLTFTADDGGYPPMDGDDWCGEFRSGWPE